MSVRGILSIVASVAEFRGFILGLDARKRQKVTNYLDKLTSSLRGKIFLCNLVDCIDHGYADPTYLAKAISDLDMRTLKFACEDELIEALAVNVKYRYVDKLYKQSPASSTCTSFSSGGVVVNVMTLQTYQAYHEDVTASMSGHAHGSMTIGVAVSKHKSTASTGETTWITPYAGHTTPHPLEKDAEQARDLLGLVHYGRDVELVALHFVPKDNTVYRPTILEAAPNERFRQVDPHQPSSELKNWGYTVDLKLLESQPPSQKASGSREQIRDATIVRRCINVKYFYLGRTARDRYTRVTDKMYLEALLYGRDFGASVYDRLKRVLA